MVENILGKGENAGCQDFLLLPKCFQKPPSAGLLKGGFVKSWGCVVKSELFNTQSRLLTTSRKKPFENILGKGENAGCQDFLLLPKSFQKPPSPGLLKGGFVKSWGCVVKSELFNTQSRLLTTSRKKPFENIVGKGENAGCQDFLLLPKCFQKPPSPGLLKGGFVKSWGCVVKSELFNTQSRLLTTSRKKPFENIVGKGENAGNQHFLLFPQRFLLYQRQKSPFELHLFCRLQMLSIWSHPKFCRLVNS